ncbi:hypothetical protein ElyMa_001133800 [Elysia marginata]|uniref:Uncharacterized protein n=1 Tax=Elysia marginata TaxID=1093978 RepID=A0AAV4HXC1_9GAST|nr:hypothetical protein ElyMa_001133800 [Elysia marginata]
MEAYFVRKGGKFLGRPITTLPNVLNKDLSCLPTGELRLKTNEDLDHLRSIAQDRQQWKGLTAKIREAAEASRSEDKDAEGDRPGRSGQIRVAKNYQKER